MFLRLAGCKLNRDHEKSFILRYLSVDFVPLQLAALTVTKTCLGDIPDPRRSCRHTLTVVLLVLDGFLGESTYIATYACQYYIE